MAGCDHSVAARTLSLSRATVSLFLLQARTAASFLLLLLFGTVAAQGQLRFDATVIDAGTMTEDDAPRHYRFVGRNVSGHALKVEKVSASCGCTRATVEPMEIAPEDSCVVSVTFSPNRYPGTIDSSVFVYLAGQPSAPAARLTLTGMVLPGADIWSRFPHKMGVLRLKQRKAAVEVVGHATRPSARILCGNSGNAPLRLSSLVLPPYARLSTEPAVVEPGAEADLVITVVADLIPATLPAVFTFPVIIEGVDGRPSDRTVHVTVSREEKK